MSVNLTPYAPAYFLTPSETGKQAPISTLELTSLKKMNNPKFLGRIVAEDFFDDSLFAELMAMGNEFTFATDQVLWEEQDDSFNPTIVNGTGAVSFAAATGTFTINNAAIPIDTFDVNSQRPKDAKWLQVKEGMQFVAFDTAGKKANGKITSIAQDKKSFVAKPIGGNWNGLGATDITVMFTGNNLDHCELAPCIGFSGYAPAYENTMFKDSEGVNYCEETEIANSPDGVDAQPLVKIGEEYYNLDERLNDAQKILTLRSENAFAFEKKLSKTEANGGQLGTNGFFTILENRATKHLGMIETKQDLLNLAYKLKEKGIKDASLRVSSEQNIKLLEILDETKYSFNPFTDQTNLLFHIGFAGFKIGEVTIRFKSWRVLDQYSNVGKRYHWVLIPLGRVRVKFNGRVTSAGYLNIGWFGKQGDVYKYKRLEKENPTGDGNRTIHYKNKFVPIVLMPNKFMMGLTI